MTDQPVSWDRIPAIVSFADTAKFTETYGFAGTSGKVNLEGQCFMPRNRPSKTLYIFMHPTSTLQLLPMPAALADAGLHVLCAASRYPKNDSALIMEKVRFDLGHGCAMRAEPLRLRQGRSGRLVGRRLAVAVLSGQAGASDDHRDAGRRRVDSGRRRLHRADGVIFIAAHLSRAETLTEWIDPSVRDEARSRRARPRTRHLCRGLPEQAAFCGRFRRGGSAPRRSRATARSRPGARSGLRDSGERRRRDRARLRRPPHDVRRALDRRDGRSRTAASRIGAFSAIRGSSTSRRPGSRAFRRCAHGCPSGATICPTPRGR